MSMLNITKVADTGEQCWGVVLLDDKRAALLRSEKGLRKGEITSIAKALKFEGARGCDRGGGRRGSRKDRHGYSRRPIRAGTCSLRAWKTQHST